MARDPVEDQLRKMTDLLGEVVRVHKNQLQETRAIHISILELMRRLVTNGETHEEEPPD